MSDVERLLFDSASVEIGLFRCPPRHRRFPAGHIDGHLVAFPWSTVVIEQNGARPVVADPNVAVLYNPQQDYARYEVDERGDYCAWYAMSEPVADEALATASGRFPATHVGIGPGGYLQHRLVVDYLRRNPAPDRLLVEEAAIAVLVGVIDRLRSDPPSRTPSRPRTALRHEELVRDAKLLVAARFREPLDLHTISREVGSSPFHLARVFRSVTGTTVHRHLMQLRLRSALGDLLESRSDLASIAVSSGLSSHSHLTKRFVDAFATTPSRLRVASRVEAELRKIVKA